MTIDRAITNIVNGTTWRGIRKLCVEAVPDKYLSQMKEEAVKALLHQAVIDTYERNPDMVLWSKDDFGGYPALKGTVSLVLMDEHTFRERLRKELETLMIECEAARRKD